MFGSFICQRVNANPTLVGNIPLRGSSALATPGGTSARDRTAEELCSEIFSERDALKRVPDDETTGLIIRALVAPLHPFGAAHLVHTVIWPSFLSAECAARKIGDTKRRLRLEGISEEEADHKLEEEYRNYAECVAELGKALGKAKKVVTILEMYNSQK